MQDIQLAPMRELIVISAFCCLILGLQEVQVDRISVKLAGRDVQFEYLNTNGVTLPAHEAVSVELVAWDTDGVLARPRAFHPHTEETMSTTRGKRGEKRTYLASSEYIGLTGPRPSVRLTRILMLRMNGALEARSYEHAQSPMQTKSSRCSFAQYMCMRKTRSKGAE